MSADRWLTRQYQESPSIPWFLYSATLATAVVVSVPTPELGGRWEPAYAACILVLFWPGFIVFDVRQWRLRRRAERERAVRVLGGERERC